MASNMNIPDELRHQITEHRGVYIGIYKAYAQLVEEVEAIDDRLMRVSLASQNNLHLVAAYAPTSLADSSVKNKFYEDLESLCNKCPKHEMLIIGADFNAKMIELSEDEESIFGKFYLKAPDGTLEGTADQTLENRRFF